ncbi:MAG: hypothetical protein HY070_07790 [Chloroflexi bacterium]|nr:hypothetical protein [Chloroflexota bacterium]
MDKLRFDLEYEWQPFKVEGRHLTFAEHQETRLFRKQCSHWGAAIYKWEGKLTRGEHMGEVGILIGETGDIRQRIKQYIKGTQKSGNLYWRKNFLLNGDILLYVLKLYSATFGTEFNSTVLDLQDFSSGNRRVVYEQLLVMNQVALNRPDSWVVNRKL